MHTIYKNRATIIQTFKKEKIFISKLVDISAIPYNGCLVRKNRRVKRRSIQKHTKII